MASVNGTLRSLSTPWNHYTGVSMETFLGRLGSSGGSQTGSGAAFLVLQCWSGDMDGIAHACAGFNVLWVFLDEETGGNASPRLICFRFQNRNIDRYIFFLNI